MNGIQRPSLGSPTLQSDWGHYWFSVKSYISFFVVLTGSCYRNQIYHSWRKYRMEYIDQQSGKIVAKLFVRGSRVIWKSGKNWSHACYRNFMLAKFVTKKFKFSKAWLLKCECFKVWHRSHTCTGRISQSYQHLGWCYVSWSIVYTYPNMVKGFLLCIAGCQHHW